MSPEPAPDENGTDRHGTDASSKEIPDEPDTVAAKSVSAGDPVDTSQPTTAAGAEAGEDESFPPRGALTLRALRWGGLIGAVVLGVTNMVWRQGLHDARSLIPDKISGAAGFAVLGCVLVWPFLTFAENKRPILVTVATTALAALGTAAAVSLTAKWWTIYQETGYSLLFLLLYAGAVLSATLALSVGPLLHYLRTTTAASIGDPDDTSRWAHLQRRTGGKAEKGRPRYERVRVPRRTRIYLIAVTLAPALILGAGVMATWAVVNPVRHVIAKTPADASLAPPTSLAPEAAWSTEISSTKLTTAAGAGGPIFLTDDGVMALNPKDGSILWSYGRKQANYGNGRDYSDASPLVASPDGKYVALRILLPEFIDMSTRTLVFDALTGRIVFENRGASGTLQLTDSAILDGQTAFSLTDGAKLWNLSEYDEPGYSGTAGHASFILKQYDENAVEGKPTDPHKSAITLKVAPQQDLGAAVEVTGTLAEPPSSPPGPVGSGGFVKGWTARYTGVVDPSGNPLAEAISLDALAKVDGADTETFPLGATSGINTTASNRSGSIVTYSAANTDTKNQTFSDKPHKETVFDPVTRTVTPVSQYPGLAGAQVLVVQVPADDGSTSAAITIRPGDGSPDTTIPITPGSTHLPPSQLASTSWHASSNNTTESTRVPGAVTIIFDATEDIESDCIIGGYGSEGKCLHTYRIFGIKGAER